MFSHVGMICFTACYLAAFLLECSRCFFRSGVRGAVMFGFAAAGWIAHTAYLYHQIVFQDGHLFNSVQGWMIAVAWALVILYLYLTVYFPKTPFGLFLLPLVLIAIGVGKHFAAAAAFPPDSVGQIWRMVHVASFLLVTVTIFLGFVTGLMYLLQAANLKRRRPKIGRLKLPPLEWLQTANSRLTGFLIVLLAVGILTGFAINRLNLQNQNVSVSPLDPMVIVTIGMFVFLLLFTVTLKKWRPVHEGKRLALVTLLCFAAMIIMLALALFSSSAHWYQKNKTQNPIEIYFRQD
ncbi:MAG: hypothetical protein LBT05_09195 [Planctomycetaceae bacterium]|jgi:ABC-type uncharacterized transport system permease subunit|nr:hypothetical protein [Planctomycetaceae bacterium]